MRAICDVIFETTGFLIRTESDLRFAFLRAALSGLQKVNLENTGIIEYFIRLILVIMLINQKIYCSCKTIVFNLNFLFTQAFECHYTKPRETTSTTKAARRTAINRTGKPKQQAPPPENHQKLKSHKG